MLDLLLEKHWRLIAVLTESSTMSHQANLFELGGFLSRISILRKPQSYLFWGEQDVCRTEQYPVNVLTLIFSGQFSLNFFLKADHPIIH